MANVVNLSSYPLSDAEIQILEKGLSFWPDHNIDVFENIKDLNLFARKLYLHVVLNRSSDKSIHFVELFKGYTVQEFLALKDMIIMMQEREEIGSLDSAIFDMEVDELVARSRETVTTCCILLSINLN